MFRPYRTPPQDKNCLLRSFRKGSVRVGAHFPSFRKSSLIDLILTDKFIILRLPESSVLFIPIVINQKTT